MTSDILVRQLALLILRMIEGSDVAYAEAFELVNEHFPDLVEDFT